MTKEDMIQELVKEIAFANNIIRQTKAQEIREFHHGRIYAISEVIGMMKQLNGEVRQAPHGESSLPGDS